MTTAVIVRPGSVPQVADATVGAPAPAVDALSDDYDASRDFFNGCTVSFDLPRYVAMVGPLTARPDRSLADVVREVAGP